MTVFLGCDAQRLPIGIKLHLQGRTALRGHRLAFFTSLCSLAAIILD